jgi:hypothetical protein
MANRIDCRLDRPELNYVQRNRVAPAASHVNKNSDALIFGVAETDVVANAKTLLPHLCVVVTYAQM